MRASFLALVLVAGCAPPQRNVPIAEIPKLTKLDDVMDAQATIADAAVQEDPRQASYTDADWAAFADGGSALHGAPAPRSRTSPKGAEFDALARCEAQGQGGRARQRRVDQGRSPPPRRRSPR